MTISRPIEPIRADDAALAKALADAHLPSLIAALAYVTGEPSLLRPELKPNTFFLAGEQGGYTPEQQAEARALCLGALQRFRDAGSPKPAPDEAALRRVLEFVIGPEPLEAYLPLLQEELSIAGRDLRAPDWTKQALAPAADFRVAIIGAGMSGLLAAHAARRRPACPT